MAVIKTNVIPLPHHNQYELCTSRAAYRQGKKLTAVKVYTVNNESQHILICGCPAYGLQDNLRKMCSQFGDVKSMVHVSDYPSEKFTDVFHVQFSKIQSARHAKIKLDGLSFFGGVLHVCYVPEMETVDETRAKLMQRQREVLFRIQNNPETNVSDSKIGKKSFHRRKKNPALPLTLERLNEAGDCIWDGIPTEIDPRITAPTKGSDESKPVYGPTEPDKAWLAANRLQRKIISDRNILTRLESHKNNKGASSSKDLHSSYSSNKGALRFIPRPIVKKVVFHTKGLNETTVNPKIDNGVKKR